GQRVSSDVKIFRRSAEERFSTGLDLLTIKTTALLVALAPFRRSGPAIAGAKTVSPAMVTIAAITSEIRVRSLKMNTTTPEGGTELRCVFKWFSYQKVNATCVSTPFFGNASRVYRRLYCTLRAA